MNREQLSQCLNISERRISQHWKDLCKTCERQDIILTRVKVDGKYEYYMRERNSATPHR